MFATLVSGSIICSKERVRTVASEYATGQSEEMEANPDDRWIEMFNARQKIFELEQIDRKFREERTAYLF
jgi:hypothetical protein